ncbi:hypothetical protein EV207_113110 [Scopulibacillus darangshiensis]|uniref:Uncharacterized protein n=1 Tax=Scopulibacillus darangshiensis TaxID=442528 RepID=A0A4R2P2W1_9BACL|nr:hypothetical protein EV207_113110 [Scopulibacillus darangshiensis]
MPKFINTHYNALLPKQGPNTIKYALTQTIVDYAVDRTNYHLILCNSNRGRGGRLNLIQDFKNKGFTSVLVHFDIPDHVLEERVAKSQRSTIIFRSASTFEEVLTRQQAESHKAGVTAPIEGEADHLFVIKDADEARSVSSEIVNIARDLLE